MARPPETRLVFSTGREATRPARAASPGEGRPDAAGGGRGIRLHLDRRGSGRVVTAVTGLPGSAKELAALARELKAACGAGGTVRHGTLELQGDQREKIEAVLAARGLRWKRAGG